MSLSNMQSRGPSLKNEPSQARISRRGKSVHAEGAVEREIYTQVSVTEFL
jgi:hypothetical protein